MFDNDASSEDKKGTRRRDALASVGINDEETQSTFIKVADWIIDDEFAVFGSGLEEILRAQFPNYTELEAEAREVGVESKPFIARYVADRLAIDGSEGWKGMKALKKALLALISE